MTRVKAKGGSVRGVDEGGGNGELPVALPPLDSTEPSFSHALPIAHPKRPGRHRPRGQRWTTPERVALYFGVCHATVCRWLKRKCLGAQVAYSRHYTDERGRKTGRGRWRIFESDLEKLLVAMRVRPGAAGLGPGFWVGGGK